MNPPPNNSTRSILIWYFGQSFLGYILGVIPNQPPSIRMFTFFTCISMLTTYTFHHYEPNSQRQKLSNNTAIVVFMTLWLSGWFLSFFWLRYQNSLSNIKTIPLIDVFSTGGGAYTVMLAVYCLRYGGTCISSIKMLWITLCGVFIGLFLLLIAPLQFLDLFHTLNVWQGAFYGLLGGYVTGRIVTIRV